MIEQLPETDPSPTVAEPRRAALAFIFVTVVLDVLALGVIIPILPKLIEDFLGGDTARAAEFLGIFSTVWALMQFIFSPIMGALSDSYGRRPVILLSNFGLGIDYIVMALAPTLGWLFLGRVVSGITGASITTAGAYIADVTPPEKRAASFGLIGAAWGLGFVMGPALGGVLGEVNPRLPFWVAAALTLVNAMYGVFVLPESLPASKRRAFSWARVNPVGSLTLLRSHHELYGLAAVNFLLYVAHQSLLSVFVLYASYRYGWNGRTTGFMLAIVGLCNIIVQGGVVKPFVARFGDRAAIMTGLVFGAAGFAVYGLASTGSIFWLGMPVMALIGLYGPASQGMMTRRVDASSQGQLQGVNTSIMGITGIIGPGIFTFVFAHFIREDRTWKLPGAPFLLAAALLVVATFAAWQVTKGKDEG